MTWRTRPFMALDTETTGVNVETDRIVTACLGVANGTERWSPRNWLFTQSAPIPQGATDVHGITTQYANDYGRRPADCLTEIVADLNKGWSMGMPVAIYNSPFDLTILDRELRRHDLPPLEVRGAVIDPLVLDKADDPYRKGSRKLIHVAQHYGITLAEEDAHGAEADALTAARLAWVLGAAWLDLQAAHDFQAIKYREQRESFARYMARKGTPVDDPSTDWPLKPLPIAVAEVA